MPFQFPPSGLGGGMTMPGAVPGMGPVGIGQPGLPIAGRQVSPVGGGPLGMLGMDDPASQQFSAVTQADGSILLHIKNADGSLGPAVKIINPIKPRGPAGM